MTSWRQVALFVFAVVFFANSCEARIRTLKLELGSLFFKNDGRRFIEITKFGFVVGGTLEVRLQNFTCPNMETRSAKEQVRVHRSSRVQVSIIEKNPTSYLSHGEMPVPSIYMVFSAIFFALFCFWSFILLSKKENVYKIHILMGVLVFLKSISVLLHGLNMYFIGIQGQQLEAWAVLYYILHLIKGSLLFGTIVLIGTGWTLFKNFLVERDRKLLMVVIPIQVVDNIALIVLDETEIGQQRYEWSSKLFILFDLICCAAVIIPILWSIKHLEQASQTDGKAVFNLQKLRLFQQFYIVVICYIYLTRIVKYLVQASVEHAVQIPFAYAHFVVSSPSRLSTCGLQRLLKSWGLHCSSCGLAQSSNQRPTIPTCAYPSRTTKTNQPMRTIFDGIRHDQFA
ncbi:Lung 7-TM R domain containing protein [Trichuris trichiura]|uniref:Lung 7-TM R domain containing protein n=1 Tax=Trichuris trichiura TaxID=36087 RepID=A0A077YX05_TRITR|nr:Lung 7-TM R domain containing protein [Trichuris trichiura]